MRPTRLVMRGFSTFRDEVEVDFADVDLAAFVGPTGSGKTSIIDALTFALYGSVVRYDDRGAVAPAVNQLSSEARVSLEFEVGGVGHRAVRVVRRTDRGATTREARLERTRADGGIEVLAGRAGEMGDAVEALLGLDFERFTRTVVLPQGRFAAFLHDRSADRQELLRRLLDMEVYARMGSAARHEASRLRTIVDTLVENTPADVPSEADVAEAARRAHEVVAAAEETAALVESLHAALAERDAAHRVAEDLGVLALATASVTVPADVSVAGRADADARRALMEAAAAWETARRASDAALAAVAAGPNVALAERQLADLDRLRATADSLERLTAAVAEAERAEADAANAAAIARAAIAAAEQAADEARARVDDARQEVAAGPDRSVLRAVAERRRELETVDAEVDGRIRAADTAAEAAAVATRDAAEADAAAAALLGRLDTLRRHKGAAGLADGLAVGDPCPVCHRPLDSLPDHDIDAELRTLTADCARADRVAARAREASDAARMAAAAADAELAAVRRRRTELTAALADAPDDAELDRLGRRADALERAHDDAMRELEAAKTVLAERRADPSTQSSLDAERAAVAAAASARASLAETSRHHHELRDALAGAPNAEALAADISRARALADAAAAARHAADEARTRHDLASRNAADAAATLEGCRHRFEQARDPLVALGPPPLAGSLERDWAALEAWAAALTDELLTRHEAARAGADRLDRRCAQVRDAIAEVASPWIGEGVAVPRIEARFATEIARAESAHEHARRRFRDGQQRLAEITAHEERRAVDQELGRLLRADGFERWLMEEAVDELVARATQRLHELSGGQYSMVASGVDFAICDHRNADELRDAKTLSGGETFLASLALALGLAESIVELAPDGAPGLGSLFLDEGFGTLDPETLDVVAAAIEELGASGRLVGIVTHIRDLADRMPVRFEVSKGPSTSTVTRVES